MANATLDKVLAGVQGRQAELDKTRQTAYRNLVVQIADGREPKADDVERILMEARRTPGDLSAAVALLVERRGHVATIAKEQAALKGSPEVVAKIDAAKAALALAQKTHDETVGPLLLAQKDLTSLKEQAGFARKRLEATAPEELHERMRELQSRWSAKRNQREAVLRSKQLAEEAGSAAEAEVYRKQVTEIDAELAPFMEEERQIRALMETP